MRMHGSVQSWGSRRRLRGVLRPRMGEGQSGAGTELDDELLWVVMASALRSGASLLRALDVVAGSAGNEQGGQLRAFAVRVRWGASWAQAAGHASAALRPMLLALAPAWEVGANADAALTMLADEHRRDRQAAARTRAARLAVHLVLPLGLCFLPAFVCLGLVPLIMAFGGGLGW